MEENKEMTRENGRRRNTNMRRMPRKAYNKKEVNEEKNISEKVIKKE